MFYGGLVFLFVNTGWFGHSSMHEMVGIFTFCPLCCFLEKAVLTVILRSMLWERRWALAILLLPTWMTTCVAAEIRCWRAKGMRGIWPNNICVMAIKPQPLSEVLLWLWRAGEKQTHIMQLAISPSSKPCLLEHYRNYFRRERELFSLLLAPLL